MSTDRQNWLAELTTVLDAYGADRSRWPMQRRHALAPYLDDPVAVRMIADAAALDRVVALAPPDPEAHLLALKARILSRVRTDTATETETDAATSMPGPVVPMRRPVVPGKAFPPRRSTQAAVLVAACLLVGIFVGSGGALDLETDEVASGTSLFEDVAGTEIEEDLI